jgi:O-antigen/teichoic acid export membrane protein
LTTFFGCFGVVIGLATALIVFASAAFGADRWIWPGQLPLFVWGAALWGWLTWANQTVAGVADSCGRTVVTEKVRMWQAPLLAALVVAVMLAGWLNLTSFFISQYVTLGALTIAWLLVLRREGHILFDRRTLTVEGVRRYAGEFYEYSHPLVVYSAMSFAAVAAERLILQAYGGSIEQGYFGLSYQIGGLCFVFTAAMTPVLAREFSVAARDGNMSRMAALFRRYVPLLYTVAAVLAAFVATESDRIVVLFGGREFAGAALPMAIMAFYPIHQTYGQLSGSIFYATGQTALYRNIGLVSMVIGLVLAYGMIAPPSRGGMGAGATGLAIKTVVIQVLTVNGQLWFNARLLGLRFPRYVLHQIVAIAAPVLLGLFARALVSPLDGQVPLVAVVFCAGVIYCTLIAFLGVMAPRLFGASRKELNTAINGGVDFVKQRAWQPAS